MTIEQINKRITDLEISIKTRKAWGDNAIAWKLEDELKVLKADLTRIQGEN